MSWLSKGLKGVERKIGSIIPHTSAAEKRQQMYATKEQMDFYKEQKDILHKQNEELTQKKDMEQRKLHEKQIRALRGTYRHARGFLGSESAPDSAPKQTLG